MNKVHGCDPNLSFLGQARYSSCWLLHKPWGKENSKKGAQLPSQPKRSATIWLFFLPRCPSDKLGWHPPEPKNLWGQGTDRHTDRHMHTDLHLIKCISLGSQPPKRRGIFGDTLLHSLIFMDPGGRDGCLQPRWPPSPISRTCPLPARCLQPERGPGWELCSPTSPPHTPGSSVIAKPPPRLTPRPSRSVAERSLYPLPGGSSPV